MELEFIEQFCTVHVGDGVLDIPRGTICNFAEALGEIVTFYRLNPSDNQHLAVLIDSSLSQGSLLVRCNPECQT